MHFDTQRGDVLLLEFAGHVSLDERRLAGTAVADQHALERRDVLFGHRFVVGWLSVTCWTGRGLTERTHTKTRALVLQIERSAF